MRKYTVISYVKDDEDKTLAVCSFLERNGMSCWIEKEQKHPDGDTLKTAIGKAISTGGYFLLFFSADSEGRDLQRIREELCVANEFTRGLPGKPDWILPIKLSECNIPDFNLYSDSNVKDLRCVELYGEPDNNMLTLLHILRGDNIELQEKPETVLRLIAGMLPGLNNLLTGLRGYTTLINKRFEVGNTNVEKLLKEQTTIVNQLLAWRKQCNEILDNSSWKVR